MANWTEFPHPSRVRHFVSRAFKSLISFRFSIFLFVYFFPFSNTASNSSTTLRFCFSQVRKIFALN